MTIAQIFLRFFALIAIVSAILIGCQKEEPCAPLSVFPKDIGNWEMKYLRRTGIIYDFDFKNAQTGYLADNWGLAKTNDAGESWEEIRIPSIYPRWSVYAIDFIDDNNGWAVVDTPVNSYKIEPRARLIKTDDGGRFNWKTVGPVFKANFRMLHFASPLRGIAITQKFPEFNELISTEDGGNTWKTVERIPFGYTMFWQIKSPDTIYVSVLGDIKKTFDGGKTWQKYVSSVHVFSEFHFLSDSLLYAIQDGNKLLKYRIGKPVQVLSDVPSHIVRIINEKEMLIIRKPLDCNNGAPTFEMDEGVRNLSYTSDGGLTWKGTTNCTILKALRYKFVEPGLGFAADGSRILTIRKN